MGETTQTRASFGMGAGRRDLQLVSFFIANHQFAVDVDDVFGIYHGLPLIPAPDYSDYVDGEIQVSELRIPVVNLRRFADLPELACDKGTPWVVAINQPGGPIGLTVDKVSEVIRLEPQQIEDLDSTEDLPLSDYVSAFANYHSRKLLLPDISRLIQNAFQ